MTLRLPVSLFNYEAGGRTAPGVYDFAKLQRAFMGDKESPGLIVLNEAKEYGLWGGEMLFRAAKVLTNTLGRPYVPRLGSSDRGLFGPAIFYDPNVLALMYWGDVHDTVPGDKRNLARFCVQGTDVEFEVMAEHWPFTSGKARIPSAERVMTLGYKKTPVLLLGDLNETASGLHLPQRDWEQAPYAVRYQKGKLLPDGTWGPHTDAVDLLIGQWEGEPFPDGRRVNGCGFHAIAELATQSGTPPELAFLPTVNTGIDVGGGLMIDWSLLNKAWLKVGGLVPGTYKVHIPEGANRKDWPSDHRRISYTLELKLA